MPSTTAPSRTDTAAAGHRGMRWQSLATLTTQAAQAVVTLGVAAAIGPREFALWGVAGVVLNAQWLIGNLGLGQALIYFRDERRWAAAVDGAFTVSLLVGTVMLGLAALLAPVIAPVFGDGFDHDDVVGVIRLISLVFLFTTLASVPQSLIEKRLDFRRRAVPEITAAVAYAVGSFALLALGFGVWSLIIAKVVQTGVLMVFFWIVSPSRPRFPPRPEFRVIRKLVGYGGVLTLGALVGFLTGNIDTIAVARSVGPAALGAYALAFTVTQLTPTFLSMTLQRVFFPIYASIRGDLERMRDSYADAWRYLAALMLPVTAALLAFGPDLLVDVFGGDWRAAGPLVRVLALYALFRGVSTSGGVLLNAIGQPSRVLVVQTVALVGALVPLVWLRDDAVEVSWAFTIGQGLALVLCMWWARSYWSVLAVRRLRAPGIATAVATGVSLVVAELTPSSVSGIAAGLAFAAVFSGLLWMLEPAIGREPRRLGARFKS